jgi:hypothetical protein
MGDRRARLVISWLNIDEYFELVLENMLDGEYSKRSVSHAWSVRICVARRTHGFSEFPMVISLFARVTLNVADGRISDVLRN